LPDKHRSRLTLQSPTPASVFVPKTRPDGLAIRNVDHIGNLDSKMSKLKHFE
jgi:hypothetical protein